LNCTETPSLDTPRNDLILAELSGEPSLFRVIRDLINFRLSRLRIERLRVSAGFETQVARWKKPGRAVEILLPEFGKPGAMDPGELEVDMKDQTCYRHSGGLDEVPAARFKEWMDRHQYDPVHSRNEPVALAAEQGAAAPPADGPVASSRRGRARYSAANRRELSARSKLALCASVYLSDGSQHSN